LRILPDAAGNALLRRLQALGMRQSDVSDAGSLCGGEARFSLKTMESKVKEWFYLRIKGLAWLSLLIAIVLLAANLVYIIEAQK
jgi:hypothetical protein